MFRPTVCAFAVVLAAAVLTGCGSADQASTAVTGDEGGAAFPVTVEHKFGSTTVESEPERVVSIGFNDHDYLYALGVAPVAARYWYGATNDVIRPWTEEAANGARPEILDDAELNVERIAALAPDLIIGLYSGIEEADYQQLSRIAPTVAQSAAFIDYGMPWQETTRLIGQAVGRSAQADELVSEVEGRFTAVRERNPGFAGQTLVLATFGAEQLGFFASQDPRSRFFTAMGFEVPARFDELAGEQFYGDLSFERTAELDVADVLVWDQLAFTEGGRATVENDALVQQLRATQEGDVVYLEGDVEDAFGWQTPLSLPFALDGIEPELARAAG